ncbi:MAG: transcriptional regulator [Planctomycetes bacterium RBG_16_64_10]|nr:MAG: transcriptional regulator [Planctomycetes bacterium RBG_16_64_10]
MDGALVSEVTPVPALDVGLQNGPLRGEIDAAIGRVCDSGQFIHGPECQRFEIALAKYCGVPHAIGCASGSDALLLALMALNMGSGDEVILPSFTFFATAGAVWRLGAKPVFVDIEPRSFNLDPTLIQQAITPATKAIIPVHLFGRCADMTAIGAVARAHALSVIEDAAQAIGAEHDGCRAGSMGAIGCFSFYPTKNLGGFGDGGILTTHDGDLAEQLRVLRDHGQHPRYFHSAVGVNSRLDSIQAAVLNVKLGRLEQWTQRRIDNAARYAEWFAEVGLDQVIGLPEADPSGRAVWNQYTIRVPGGRRDALVEHLSRHRIGTAVYYPLPLHRQECFKSLGYQRNSLPETEQAADEVLSLPIFPGLTERQQRTVVAQIAAFYRADGALN